MVIFQYDFWLIFIIWRMWFLKKVKLFHQFLMENFGDLVMSVFISIGLIMCVYFLSISVFSNKIIHIFFVIVCSRSTGK